MAETVPERWVLVIESYSDDERPVPQRVKQLLKYAARACGLRCVQVRDAEAGESREVEELVEALCDRVYAQGELLAKRAEKTT